MSKLNTLRELVLSHVETLKTIVVVANLVTESVGRFDYLLLACIVDLTAPSRKNLVGHPGIDASETYVPTGPEERGPQ